METANVYGDLTKTGLGWGFVGLRVEGLVGGKKLKTEKRWSKTEQQGWLLCTHTLQKTWTDEEKESPKTVRHKSRSMNRY